MNDNIRILAVAMKRAEVETIGELLEYCRAHGTTPAALAQEGDAA